ncbi:MAG: type II 3-dehydroquinate dehydratase [Cytophagales bacterium]|nr:MAG: type II 3-dehydroquinate dehydratase [Cytophagales bacterium]
MNNINIINGVNLNLLGKREPAIYGSQTFEDYLATLQEKYASVANISYFQSNIEGEIVNQIQAIGFGKQPYLGIILNAGAYTHTSIAIADAIKAISTPVVEVHISNVFAREAFRHHSFLSPVCKGMITGLGLLGYDLALQYLLHLPEQNILNKA